MPTGRRNPRMKKNQACPEPASAGLACLARQRCLEMVHRGGSGHLGSMLSMADIVAVLYSGVLRVDPERPDWPERDRFVLSKGHAGGALYAVLAERGFFPAEKLERYYLDEGLSGHVSHHVPGVEFSTGSLGHGLPVAVGMALDAKLKSAGHRVFCLMSDGDCNEGSTWEAIMFAARHCLDNLVGIVDYNRVQALGAMEEVIEMEPFARKLELFGWAAREVDGHDHGAMEKCFSALPFEPGKPSWVLARTTKCKGIGRLENTVLSHYGCIRGNDQFYCALEELGGKAGP